MTTTWRKEMAKDLKIVETSELIEELRSIAGLCDHASVLLHNVCECDDEDCVTCDVRMRLYGVYKDHKKCKGMTNEASDALQKNSRLYGQREIKRMVKGVYMYKITETGDRVIKVDDIYKYAHHLTAHDV